MKVTQIKSNYEPLTVTLETEEELNTFINLCEAAAEYARSMKTENDASILAMAIDLSNRTLNPHCAILNPS